MCITQLHIVCQVLPVTQMHSLKGKKCRRVILVTHPDWYDIPYISKVSFWSGLTKWEIFYLMRDLQEGLRIVYSPRYLIGNNVSSLKQETESMLKNKSTLQAGFF